MRVGYQHSSVFPSPTSRDVVTGSIATCSSFSGSAVDFVHRRSVDNGGAADGHRHRLCTSWSTSPRCARGPVVFLPVGLLFLPQVSSRSLGAVASTCRAGSLAAMDLIGQERCEHVFQGVLLLSLVRFWALGLHRVACSLRSFLPYGQFCACV